MGLNKKSVDDFNAKGRRVSGMVTIWRIQVIRSLPESNSGIDLHESFSSLSYQG